jgi:hypothetical protein
MKEMELVKRENEI